MAFKDIVNPLQDILRRFRLIEAETDPDPELQKDEEGILRASDWKPKDYRRRVEIMVTGDPSRVGAVADAIDEVQKKIFDDASGKNPEIRVTAFLDNCIHRSKWNKKPFKAASQARRWHCEQSKTRFVDALNDSKGEFVDDLVLIGHRFDDDMEAALAKADELRDLGVRIHCFHTGQDRASREAYEQLAERTKGVFMQLEDQSSIAEVMPVLMAHLNDEEAFAALQPKNKEAQALKRLLIPDAPDLLD